MIFFKTDNIVEATTRAKKTASLSHSNNINNKQINDKKDEHNNK